MPNLFDWRYGYVWDGWHYSGNENETDNFKSEICFIPSVMEVECSKLFFDERKGRKRAKVV